MVTRVSSYCPDAFLSLQYSSLVGSTYPESGLEVPGARILRVESASGEVRFTEDEVKRKLAARSFLSLPTFR